MIKHNYEGVCMFNLKRNEFKRRSNLVLVIGSIICLAACAKEANSKANYIFKAAPEDGLVAKIGEEKIMASDFYKGIESDLYEAEMKVYEIKFNRLQTILMEKFINLDPKKKSLSNEEYLNQFIAKDIKVSEKEIGTFIKEKQVPKEQVNAEIKERIKQYIEMEKKKDVVEKWMAKEVNKSKVEVYIQKPKRPVFQLKTEGAPSKGPSDAKVTLVEYSDFQCPFCSKAAATVAEIEKKYGKKVRIVFKNFPLPFHNNAKIASEGALCAESFSKGAFWKMHDGFFADQSKLSREDIIALAVKNKINETDFKACLDNKTFAAKVEEDIKEGQELGIKSTPTFFINGQLVAGALPLEAFSEIIDEELNK